LEPDQKIIKNSNPNPKNNFITPNPNPNDKLSRTAPKTTDPIKRCPDDLFLPHLPAQTLKTYLQVPPGPLSKPSIRDIYKYEKERNELLKKQK
jgi:hypothetical protein